MDIPPPLRESSRTDLDQLRLLSIFHFVVAGLGLLGLCFLTLHFIVLSSVFSSPEVWTPQDRSEPPPAQVFGIFRWFYLAFALFLIAGTFANLLSGLFIQKRKNRIFSLIIAGLNCAQFPFGTALGVFTFFVLLRDSVQRLYAEPPLSPLE